MKKENFYTLDYMRGIGAVLVIFYHYYIFFFNEQSFSSTLLQVPALELTSPFYLDYINHLPFDIGHLGVAFFFLISGFLIQSTLQRYPFFKQFLTHKFFRLWPVYVFSFTVGLLFVFFFSGERYFPYSAPHMITHALWLRDILHYPYIDGSVWTLEIQIKFYIFAALLWHWNPKTFTTKVCFTLTVGAFLSYGLLYFTDVLDTPYGYLALILQKNIKFFTLISMGALLYSFYKKDITLVKFLVTIFILICLFFSPLLNQALTLKMNSYFLGIIIFSLLLFWEKRYNLSTRTTPRLVKWLSKISYPLYVGHVLPGYVMLYAADIYGINLQITILIAIGYSFIMAHIVHQQIERRFFH